MKVCVLPRKMSIEVLTLLQGILNHIYKIYGSNIALIQTD